MKNAAHRFIQSVWYEGSRWFVALLPLAAVYWALVALRRLLFRKEPKRR